MFFSLSLPKFGIITIFKKPNSVNLISKMITKVVLMLIDWIINEHKYFLVNYYFFSDVSIESLAPFRIVIEVFLSAIYLVSTWMSTGPQQDPSDHLRPSLTPIVSLVLHFNK